MGLNLDEKKAVVAEVSAQVANAQTIVIAEYSGLEVVQLTKLRAQARKSGVYLRVLKNTLVRRAVSGSNFAELAGQMTGPLIYGISSDPVAAATARHSLRRPRRAQRPSRHPGSNSRFRRAGGRSHRRRSGGRDPGERPQG